METLFTLLDSLKNIEINQKIAIFLFLLAGFTFLRITKKPVYPKPDYDKKRVILDEKTRWTKFVKNTRYLYSKGGVVMYRIVIKKFRNKEQILTDKKAKKTGQTLYQKYFELS